jgi:YfiH family protein
MTENDLHWLDWPAPRQVKACYTLRSGGVSVGPYQSLNLGDHVGDCSEAVLCNRQQLASTIGQASLTWLTQVHGTQVISLPIAGKSYEADGCFTLQPQQVCCVMTADCLPVFLCDHQGTQVAMAHAGWRGLLDGILQQTVNTFDSDATLMAYLGPAISQAAFEVGDEVRTAFLQKNRHFEQYFIPSEQDSKWMANLYGIARSILTESGVTAIYGGAHCTYSEADTFFSYRRDGLTGRMANLIWLE